MAKTSQPTKDNIFGLQFKSKVDDLVEWGLDEGYKIDAFLRTDINGIIPIISFIELSDKEKAQYAEHKKIMVEEMKVKKDTIAE